MSYKISQVALQLFTVRDACKTVPEFAETLARVKKMGFQAVQVSGIKLPYPDMKKAIDDAGLIVCATHEPGDQILEKPEEICERLKLMGTPHTAYPWPGTLNFSDEPTVRDFAKKLDAAGAVLAKNGCVLSYHNHALEFVRLGEATALDYIYKATNPANLKAELDTYWVQYGGGDSVTWINKVAGRAPLLHLKDYLYKDDKPTYGEIGYGNLDWKGILAAAEKAGTEWLIIEQDVCPGDPFVSVEKSFNYLKNLLGA